MSDEVTTSQRICRRCNTYMAGLEVRRSRLSWDNGGKKTIRMFSQNLGIPIVERCHLNASEQTVNSRHLKH